MPTIEFSLKKIEEKTNLSKEKILEIIENSKVELEEIENDKIKVTIPAERLDLIFLNGFCNFLLGKYKELKIEKSEVKVKAEKVEARPYFACFIVEGLELTEEDLKEIILFQENLHKFLGRDRKFVAIGIHDLDKIKGNIVYKEAFPDEKFVPLTYEKEMSLKEVLEITDKGKKYGNLINKFEKYPAIYDEESIISFPPILNSEKTKLTVNTKRIFVDITGTFEKAVEDALNLLIYFFSLYGKIKSLELNGKEFPKIEEKVIVLDLNKVNKIVGLNFSSEEIKDFLSKAGLIAEIENSKIKVKIPFYRLDIFGERDVIEEIAIAYGYNNFEPRLPNLFTKGKIHKREKIEKRIREILIGLGFTEVLNTIFINKNLLEKCLIKEECLELENPVSEEYSLLRNYLFPSLINFVSKNLDKDFPQKIFEIGYVVKNLKEERRIAFLIASNETNLSELISYIKAFFNELKIDIKLEKFNFDFLIKGRSGKIFANNEEIGFFGEVNPQVLENFGIKIPIAYCEIYGNKIYSRV
ncbi:MAG: phenylalanine--tRNA ligase subunit beta [Candidatus Aenigmatarchaeota archaeon]